MKITDTIGMVLKRKGNAKILSMRPEQSVFEALELMAQYDIGALLVLTGENLVGIFSERDYARKCALLGHQSRETLVSEIMTTAVPGEVGDLRPGAHDPGAGRLHYGSVSGVKSRVRGQGLGIRRA